MLAGLAVCNQEKHGGKALPVLLWCAAGVCCVLSRMEQTVRSPERLCVLVSRVVSGDRQGARIRVAGKGNLFMAACSRLRKVLRY